MARTPAFPDQKLAASAKPERPVRSEGPARRGGKQAAAAEPGAKLAANTWRLEPVYWDRLRKLAALKGTTGTAELRNALSQYLDRELPKALAAAQSELMPLR
jgi:hypothetical protein